MSYTAVRRALRTGTQSLLRSGKAGVLRPDRTSAVLSRRFARLCLNWLRKRSSICVVISLSPSSSWLLSTCWWSSFPPWRISLESSVWLYDFVLMLQQLFRKWKCRDNIKLFSYFTGVTSANMLIFILPSSLYLKITNQDGDKGTQRIWVCLMPATLVFLISFSLKLTKKVVRLCHLILLLAATKKGSSPAVFPLGDLNYFIRIPFPQKYLFRYYSYCTFGLALRLGQGLLGGRMFIILCLYRRCLIFSNKM